MRFLYLSLVTLLLISSFAWSASAETSADATKQVDLVFCNNGHETGTLDLRIDPGETAEICYRLINRGSDPVWVRASFVDARPRGDSGLVTCLQETDPRRFFANFVQNNSERIFLKPKQIIEKTTFVTFPTDSIGTHQACITIIPDATAPTEGTMQIVLRSIYKIRARLTSDNFDWDVALEAAEIADTGLELIKESGPVTIFRQPDGILLVDILLEDSSNLPTGITATLRVQGLGFEFKDQSQLTLLAHDRQHLRFPLPKLPFYQGFFRFTIETSQTELGDISTESQQNNFSISILLLPLWLSSSLAFVLFVVSSWLGWRVWRARRLNHVRESYLVQPGDTITHLAKRFGCSWQDIARVNRIKSPYLLVEGSIIFVFNLQYKK